MTKTKTMKRKGFLRGKKVLIFLSTISIFIIVFGIVVLTFGKTIVMKAVLNKMVLRPGSDTLKTWGDPPIQTHQSVYIFNVTNPNEVLQGAKPNLVEIGPVVYKTVLVKDSLDEETGKSSLNFSDSGEFISYQPRKYLYLDREKSVIDPDEAIITVPNVPLLTGLSKLQDMGFFAKLIGQDVITGMGRGTPFITLPLSKFLWGYEDDMPCKQLPVPLTCASDSTDDPGFIGSLLSSFVEGEKKKTLAKREAAGSYNNIRTLHHGQEIDEKAEYVDCKCHWGILRGQNMSLAQSLTINTGKEDIKLKGYVEEFNHRKTFGKWKNGSDCDKIGGYAGVLPPSLQKYEDLSLSIFLPPMCRRLDVAFEEEKESSKVKVFRFSPPENALGSHTDQNQKKKNAKNSCFCLEEEGLPCMKSGVVNVGPCQRSPLLPKGPPLAVSFPHFYQADPSYTVAVDGLKPNKEKHQIYIDMVPDLGVPLSFKVRFQLNVIVRGDPDIDIISNVTSGETVLPLLWIEEGFSSPSDYLLGTVKQGLFLQNTLPILTGIIILVFGTVFLAFSLLCIKRVKDS